MPNDDELKTQKEKLKRIDLTEVDNTKEYFTKTRQADKRSYQTPNTPTNTQRTSKGRE